MKRELEGICSVLRECREKLEHDYGVRAVGIFGSWVRGEQSPSSDLDVLVEIIRAISLLELVGVEIYLSEKLGMEVDVVPRRSLREELRETILRETIAL